MLSHSSRCALWIFAAVATVVAPHLLSANEIFLGSQLTGGTNIQTILSSYSERRFLRTLKQQADFSCGSAALATLLTYHYARPSAERDVLTDMVAHGDRAQIETQGFSLLDMRNYLARQGLSSGGYRLTLDKIAEVRVPGIVLINHNGYNHFVVLEGLHEGRVLLADPSVGTRAMDVATFEKEWNGVLFLIRDGADFAQTQFNLEENWEVQPQASWSQIRNLYELSRVVSHNGLVF